MILPETVHGGIFGKTGIAHPQKYENGGNKYIRNRAIILFILTFDFFFN